MKFTLFIFVFGFQTIKAEDHLDDSQMSFLRYVLPDYFSKVSDLDLEQITAFQTDEKLSFDQQKEGTFRILDEKGIDEEVVQHFRDLYRLEDEKRSRFDQYLRELKSAIDQYFAIENKRSIPIGEKKEMISNLLDRLEKPVSESLKVAANLLESSRILNASRKKTVGAGTGERLADLDN